MIYALTDLQTAAQAAAAVAQERAGLEDQIFQLEGNVAAQRFKAMQELDASNRPLLAYIYALQDQQAATAAATQAAQEAAQAEAAMAQERAGLMSAALAADRGHRLDPGGGARRARSVQPGAPSADLGGAGRAGGGQGG